MARLLCPFCNKAIYPTDEKCANCNATFEICYHERTRGLDYIENSDTGEILENDFRECLNCGKVWID